MITRVVLVFCIAAAAACIGSAPRAQDFPAPCDGTEVAMVENETRVPIEVSVFSGKASVLLGTAPTGRSEFALPRAEGVRRFSARTLDGQNVRMYNATSGVRISVECRRA
jgi:hypothetical protein